jgi:glycosyltransferase involved in cell wall biosynthesis
MERNKVLLIIPELTTGGAQRSLAKLSLMLAQHHQVGIVLFNDKSDIAYTYGGELLYLHVGAGSGVVGKTLAFLTRIRRLHKLKRRFGADVAISFLEGADYINILSRHKEKIVLSVRGSKHHDETIASSFPWVRNKVLIPFLYRRADVIVTVNQGIARELVDYGLEKVRRITISNFYDSAEIQALAAAPKTAGFEDLYQDPVLVTTGRLAREKGLAPLIRIFAALKEKYPQLRLVLVGDGPLRGALVTLSKALGLATHEGGSFTTRPDVVFAGNQSNVYQYLRGARLYLMNSSSEGFPNGLAEAMICQVPVVAADCPYGPREILAPEIPYQSAFTRPYLSQNGILMPMIRATGDEKIWVEILDDVLGKNELLSQLAGKARTRIGMFDREEIMAQWNSIITGASDESKRR